MNVIMGMKEINTPLKLIGLRIFKAYDGNFFFKLGKRPRRRLFGSNQHEISRKIAN